MSKITPMLYPVIYRGPKQSKSQIIPGRPNPLVFQSGPDFDGLYAYATEAEAQWMARQCKDLYEFPQGTRNTTDVSALYDRIDRLTERVEALEAQIAANDEKPKRTRKAAEPELVA